MAEIINICPRMMTIEQLIDTVKQADENTAITRYFVRQLCKENKIVHIKAGQKYLINYDKFIDYLNYGGEDECQKASTKNG
ncbi:MAG: hypothetical protein SOX82_11735 [Eubacteriales bacterium]|jgi:excisionase family DNA binding protein|nr:hypothetical protein [Eubacteriales bacterium]MDY5231563.1 hypothetical protein [Eubacteriales bacterium]